MPDTSPLVQTLRTQVDAVAAGADGQFVLGEASFAGTITRAAYVPSAAITGANTNSRTITVTNRGSAGAGTNVGATVALTTGVNAAADDAKELALSGTPANLAVAAGDVLTVESTHVGNGIADPGGTFIVEITRS